MTFHWSSLKKCTIRIRTGMSASFLCSFLTSHASCSFHCLKQKGCYFAICKHQSQENTWILVYVILYFGQHFRKEVLFFFFSFSNVWFCRISVSWTDTCCQSERTYIKYSHLSGCNIQSFHLLLIWFSVTYKM